MIIDAPVTGHIPALRSLWKQAFGDTDAFLDTFFSVAFSPERCRCVLVNDRLAAALYWFDCNWDGRPIAYLYAVATDAAFQGQGMCRALMENTHAHLQKLGYHGCILVPGSSDLFAMYGKMGYTTCSHIREFESKAGKPLPLRQLTAEEYATLRRQYLPAGGVVQEGETLALLQTQSKFYAGENCVFIRTGKHTVSELLGNTEAAPGIVATLGCQECSFRTPGSEKPFAMYHSLANDPAAPTYFGLAMD